MNKCSNQFILRVFYIFLIFIVFQSCDQKSIAFSPPDEDGLNFKNSSIPISVDNSNFTMNPSYVNQDLGPLLYVGNLPYAGSSYALFQINSSILADFNLCENDSQEIKNRGDIEFRIVGDNLFGDYSNLFAYYYQGQIDFIEDDFSNYDSDKINQIVDDVKSNQQQLFSRVDDDAYTGVTYFTLLDVDECTFKNNEQDCLDNDYSINTPSNVMSKYKQCFWDDFQCSDSEFNASSFLDWDNFCLEDQTYFYILLEYPEADQEQYHSIYSSHILDSEPESINSPSLMVYYEREVEQNNFYNRFDVDELSISELLNIGNILYTSDEYSYDFDCSDNEEEDCNEYEYCQWDSEIIACSWSDETLSDNLLS